MSLESESCRPTINFKIKEVHKIMKAQINI